MKKSFVTLSRAPLATQYQSIHTTQVVLSCLPIYIKNLKSGDHALLRLLQEHHYLLAVNKNAPQIANFHSQLHPSIKPLYDRMLTANRITLDFTQNYAPAVLLNYFVSGIFDIELTPLDADAVKGLKLDVKDDIYGHACTGDYLYRCMGPGILSMVPLDEVGTVYAINPIFELSGEEVISLITDDAFDLEQYTEHMINTIITRLTSPNVEIPVAHPDYQHPEVVQLGGLNYKKGQAECAKCNLGFAAIKTWRYQNGRIVAQPEFSTCCPAANSELSHQFRSERAFTVNIPTGDLFFADWLRDKEGFGVRLLKNHDYDINTLHGRMQASAYFASKNVVHGSTDNGSCFLISNLDGTVLYIVGNYNDKKLDKLGLRYVGGISTDLWGYTMMDRAHLEPLSSPAHQCMLQDLIHPVSSHQWEVPGMLQVKPGNYFHFYFNSYGRDIDKMLAQLPTDVQDTVKALKVSALHGVLIHKELIA